MDAVISNKKNLAVALSVMAYMADRSEPEGFFSCGKAIKVRDIDSGDYRMAWTDRKSVV